MSNVEFQMQLFEDIEERHYVPRKTRKFPEGHPTETDYVRTGRRVWRVTDEGKHFAQFLELFYGLKPTETAPSPHRWSKEPPVPNPLLEVR